MATVNFSVPEQVKDKFNEVFAGKNKSQVIAELMMRAVEEEALRKQRAEAIDALFARRRRRPVLTKAKLNALRKSGRP